VLQRVVVCCSVLQCVAVTIVHEGVYNTVTVYRTRCVAACCSVLQCPNATGCTVTRFHVGVYSTFTVYCARYVAACCSVLQRVAMSKCNRLYCYDIPRRSLYTTPGVWERAAVCCSVLQCVAARCSVLQRVAVYCNVLQCTDCSVPSSECTVDGLYSCVVS